MLKGRRIVGKGDAMAAHCAFVLMKMMQLQSTVRKCDFHHDYGDGDGDPGAGMMWLLYRQILAQTFSFTLL